MASKSKRSVNAPSQRQLRIGESLRHALAEILAREDFFEPDLENVSILKFAKGYRPSEAHVQKKAKMS